MDLDALPTSWSAAHVQDVASRVESGFPSGKHNQDGRGVPHLRPMNISRDGALDLTEVKYVEDKDGRRLCEGDVLFNNTNSPPLVGKTAVVTGAGDWAFSNHMTRIRPFPGVSPKFLAHQLHYLWMSGYLRHRCVNHVNQASIAAKTLATTVPIVLPPAAEQERIVAAIEEQFSRLDAAQTLLRKALRRLESLRINAVASAYASDWPWTTLGEIAQIVGGVTKDSKRQSDPSFVEVPYLRVANVQRGYLDLTEITTIRVSPEKAKALSLEPGDVLFNEGGDRDKLGRGWVWSGEIDHCIHQNHVFRARLAEGFDPRFVSWHGNTFGQRWFNTHGRQTTNLASLNLTTLKSFPVPAPSLADQRRAVATIEQQLSIIDATVNAVRSALVQGGALRRAVLNSAFSGRLVPQDPTDEPASVLLDRLVAERGSSDDPKPSRTRQHRRKAAA